MSNKWNDKNMHYIRKGFILPFIAVSIIVIFTSVIAVLLLKNKSSEPINSNQRSADSGEKQWKGLLLTKSGLIKTNDQGIFEKKDGNTVIYPTPKIIRAGDFNPFRLREDGELLVIGSSDVSTDFSTNVLYGWNVGSKEGFRPIFRLEKGKKIQVFAFSPDYKQIAITYVTRTNSEQLEYIDSSKIDADTIKKELETREKILQAELRTVTIYDATTSQVVASLQLPPVQSPSRRIGSPALVWNKKGLFTKEMYSITIFDANTWKEIGSIAGTVQPSYIIISPDGAFYYDITTLEARSIPGNALIAKLDAPEFIAPNQMNENTREDKIVHPSFATFSNDSKKLIITGTSLREQYFVIWELNLKTGKTRWIGDLNSLDFGENIDYQWKKAFMPLYFTPNDSKIVFNLYQEKEHAIGRLDYFTFTLGGVKTDYHERFTDVTGWPDLSSVNFLGWYVH